MGMEGVREDLWEAFRWPLPGLLPSELGKGEHSTAKHFPGLQAKVVDREGKGTQLWVSSPKALKASATLGKDFWIKMHKS